MPRGRHRQSPPLHRLLPPATVAGASIACAAGAWCVGDDLVQRVLAAGAAAAALTGAVLLRTWDRTAGRRVAELDRARVRDEWRTEERIAELETDVEESRERRAALDAKLRAKRAELARLRTEHADLLRRYATAETERASALEGRRLLAIEAAAPPRRCRRRRSAPRARLRPDGETSTASFPVRREAAANGDGQNPAASPVRATATFAEADRALRQLARNAARQRTAQKAARLARDGAGAGFEGPPPPGHARPGRAGTVRTAGEPAGGRRTAHGRRTSPYGRRPGPALRPVPATAALAPSAPPHPARRAASTSSAMRPLPVPRSRPGRWRTTWRMSSAMRRLPNSRPVRGRVRPARPVRTRVRSSPGRAPRPMASTSVTQTPVTGSPETSSRRAAGTRTSRPTAPRPRAPARSST
ncbi:hypothetical protein O1L68_17770 [Streptomyces lydicus]|nr:hypothetical protein [Streptomyces lydicus]